jgi:hypothetical protein
MLLLRGYLSTNLNKTDQTARFSNSHSLLQSRSTTQPDDLPLILVNMSGMNGNTVARAKGTENKMKLLFYGLGILPIELLFSECARISYRQVDSWIPKEVVPETFSGDHSLRLGSNGFSFHHRDGSHRLKFFMLPSSTIWQEDVQISVLDDEGLVIKGPETSDEEPPITPENGWCILLEDDTTCNSPRGARFIVNRLQEKTVFLHFDCSIRLSKVNLSSQRTEGQLPNNVYRPANADREFIIERSDTPQDLRMPRPQTQEQYSDRIIVTGNILSDALIYSEQYFFKSFLDGVVSKSTLLLIIYGGFVLVQRELMERALKTLTHRAWIETFYPDWNPNGRWKWFWKLLNYVPPVPFKTMMKYWCMLLLSVSLSFELYSAAASVTMYWYVVYPKEELASIYLISFAIQGLSWLFGVH